MTEKLLSTFYRPIAILLVLSMEKTTRHQNFELIYKKFALPTMKFLVKRMGGDTTAAEEVFQRTVVAAWQGFNTFENKSTYFTWLCRIALNKMADYYREQVNYRSTFISPTLEQWANLKDRSLTPEEKLALNELRDSVHQCLDLLPEDKRNLLYLRYWKEMSLSGIAEMLGISERAAEGKLYRAKLALREVVEEKYPNLK